MRLFYNNKIAGEIRYGGLEDSTVAVGAIKNTAEGNEIITSA